MPTVELFGLGHKGRSNTVTAQRRQNCYLEIQGDPERGRVAVHGTPGLARFANLTSAVAGLNGDICGAHVMGGYLYVVIRVALGMTRCVRVDANGTQLDIWTAVPISQANNGWIYSADNGQKIYWLDADIGNAGYSGTLIQHDPSGLLTTQHAIAVFDGAHETIAYLDGYFIAGDSQSNKFNISTLGSPLVWDSLDFASAESNPDRIMRVFVNHGELVLFGERSTEFWANTGGQDFPFTRIQGASCEWGLAAKRSVAKIDNTIAFLATNDQGQITVMRLAGYQPQRISNNDLDYEINRYGNVSDAQAFSYLIGGHQMYEISFPGADVSWLYDAATNLWSRVKSFGVGRHRAQWGGALGGKTIVLDYSGLDIYELTDNSRTDAGDPIEFEIITRHIAQDNAMIVVDHLDLIAEVGVGSQAGSDPKIMLQVSKDGGNSWGAELWRSLGKVGETRKRVDWRRLGRGRDWTFKLRITDDCKRTLMNASMDISAGRP